MIANKTDISRRFVSLSRQIIIFLLAFLSGFYGRLQILAILVLPLCLYITCFGRNRKSFGSDWVRLLMVVAGCVFIWVGCWLALAGKILSWSVGVLLLTTGIHATFRREASKRNLKVVGATVVFVMISVLSVGYNPFVGTDCSVDRQFRDYAYSKRGVYIIKRDGLIGLRDRFSIIEKPKFQSINILNPSKPFLAVSLSHGAGVYNLETHKYDVKPSGRCVRIEKLNDTIWNMVNSEGRVDQQIILPKFWMRDFESGWLTTRMVDG